jgi:DNA-binding NarL/FixJ family response regulator
VVMLSNSALDADRKRAKAAGVDGYFVKLPKPEVIAKIVADASAV